MEPDLMPNLEKCHKYIEKIKESDLHSLYPKLSDDLDELKKNLISQKVSIILFGGTSSGKTTFANLLCSYDENKKDYPFNKELLEILPQADDENTYYTWIIEASDDEKFVLKKGKKEKQYYEKIEDFRNEIKKINDEQVDHINDSNLNNKKDFNETETIELRFNCQK